MTQRPVELVGLVDIAVEQLETQVSPARLPSAAASPRRRDLLDCPARTRPIAAVLPWSRPEASRGRRRPPTVFMTEIFDNIAGALFPTVDGQGQCAAHPDVVERLFFLWFGVIGLPQFQSLSCTVDVRAPERPPARRGVDGGKAAELNRGPVAADRADPGWPACRRKMPVNPSRYGSPLW